MEIKGNLLMKVLKDGEVIEYKDHNTLTKLFEHIILGSSIGALLSSNTATELGTSYINFPMRQGYTGTSSYAMTSLSTSDLITIYLLNLTTEEQAALNKNIKKNPIVGTNMVLNDDALVGYATCSYGGTAQKEGIMMAPDSKIGIDCDKFPIAFKWNPGKLSGIVNTIIIGTNIIYLKEHSVSLARGVDIMNPVLNEKNSIGYFLTAGCSTPSGVVLTAENEILLGDGVNSSTAKRVLNLETGLETVLETTDPRYSHTLYQGTQYYIGDGRIAVCSFAGTSVYVYNLETGAQIKRFTNSTGFAVYNNMLYVKNNSSTAPKLLAYNLETLNAETASDITLTFPSHKTNVEDYYISNFGHNFIFTKQTSASAPPDLALNTSVVFSDITNPFESFVCGYMGQIGTSITFKDKEFYVSKYAQEVYHKNATTDQVFTISGELSNCIRSGVKITDLSTDYGQVFTYATLSTPITFTETDGFEITYYFNI